MIYRELDTYIKDLEGGAGVWALEDGGVQTRLHEKRKKIRNRKIKKKKFPKKIAKKKKGSTWNILAICCDIPERAYFAL